MTVRELRDKYLRFFESKGHTIYPSGSLVPVDVTGRLDESLLFNGAGMVQFKPFFRGTATPENKRLTTAQKCVRTGDIDETGDDSHLTFFEMMGNFSFGDYFKKEAIAYSWEFLTSPSWLNLDPRRLSFTVFSEDEEAYGLWSEHLAKAGIEPNSRVFKLGEETNYWPAGAFSAGPPGPCGPNSEMFYWVGESPPGTAFGDYSREAWIQDDADGNWLEIWNDVFIQYEWQGQLANSERPSDGYSKSGMPNLPFQSIDTGMGLERTSAVLSGKRSVYDTDAFAPILKILAELYGKEPVTSSEVRAFRIVADHIRTAAFCLAEGIRPGNGGRSYVLRRLLRRAILKGTRTLGFQDIFLPLVYEGVVEALGGHYQELSANKATISEHLKNEESLFRRTLDAGSELLQSEIDRLVVKNLPGSVAFRLYDTFGFPLEVTKEICLESGITVDEEGYEVSLKEAQERSRSGTDRQSVYGGVEQKEELALADAKAATNFVGYDRVRSDSRIERIRPTEDGRAWIALNESSFYAESGGQSGDTGHLNEMAVLNTTKAGGIWWHEVEIGAVEPKDLLGIGVKAEVDESRRARIKRHHTATHLLQAALRQLVGEHVAQAGSFVGPNSLRFDFTHSSAVPVSKLREIEASVNQQALLNTDVVTYVDMPIDEARARGAMALFGEKYGDKVRMVEIGEFSRELCGGIHVRTTGEIGMFRILSENSAASGVRRIEAVAGEAAIELATLEAQRMKELADLLKSIPSELVQAVEKTLSSLKEERKKREKAERAALSGQTIQASSVLIRDLELRTQNFGSVEPQIAAEFLDNAIAENPNLVVVVSVTNEGKLTFSAKAGKAAVAQKAHVGNILKEISKIAGGGGGGRPDFATAGGRDVKKADEALNAVEIILRQQLGAE